MAFLTEGDNSYSAVFFDTVRIKSLPPVFVLVLYSIFFMYSLSEQH